MPPSLRRTISSPSVRSSPYPSLSHAVNGATASRGNGHRRSSGSETTGRRVLADIEWWRVVDGQRDADADQESEDHNRDQTLDDLHSRGLPVEEIPGAADISTDVGAEHLAAASITPLVEGTEETPQTLPTNEFAALSITPHSPLSRNHSRQSSGSSLESTPEAAEPAFHGLRLAMFGLDSDFPEATLPAFPVLRRGPGCTGVTPPLFSLRAHSFMDVVSFKNDTASHYADFTVSPLSSASPHLCN
ncbi:hypothetical protein Hypma_010590 [Hypsizygus marmoreus]|uniref:Uncharacterized protein n=1 Tax=Hypsizygus marmoreus TaxID=39966 RepID=A0A369JLP5_HYPMA|nr:hypothetical protein Hypma_010590 [Hypsizygus marmoreus]